MTPPDRHPRIAAGALVAAGILASSVALATLVTPPSWLVDAVVGLTVVALAGMLGRSRLGSPVAVVLVQLGCLVLALGWLFGVDARGSTLWLGVFPGPATLAHWADLLAQARTLIEVSATPVPPEPGIAFLLVAAVCLLAIVTDMVAVSLDSPAVAGLVMLIPFLTAVANSDGSLPVPFFLVPALTWVALLVEHDRRLLSHWWAAPRPNTPMSRMTSEVAAQRWGTATTLASAGLVLALITAALAPRLPVKYLAEGLGRSTGLSGEVAFSPTLDLLADLRSTNTAQVLVYRTNDPTPAYLRVAVSQKYETGAWRPEPVATEPSSAPQLPTPPGLSDQVPRTRYDLSVDQTALAAPYLAAPYPLVGGMVTDARWAVDAGTGIAVADRTPSRYTMPYAELTPSRAVLARAVPDESLAADLVRPDTMSLRSDTVTTLEEFLPETVVQAPSPYEQAVALQEWLRSQAFTYSLELAPVPAGLSPSEAASTSLARFLRSKRGYCVQFATTMALMARVVGIPSRVVTGFLPGTREGEQWVVRAKDAHAWPELYFPGVGWLPFEPTPADRAVQTPEYSTPSSAATAVPRAGSPTTEPEPVPAASDPALDPRDRDSTNPNLAGEGNAQGWPGWLWLLLTGLGVLGLLLVLPVTAWLTRRREVTRARTEADRVEAHWRGLTSQLADLGLTIPVSMTVPEQRTHLRRAALLAAEPDAALGRLADAVEQARYAPHPDLTPGLADDSAAVLAGAAQLRSRRMRWRARLWPTDGRRVLFGAARLRRLGRR